MKEMQKVQVGLTMIVKNEEKVLSRCLRSVFDSGIIDYYYIVDTGSTDRTKDVITKLADEYKVQGEIFDMPFTNFAECRNIALNGLRKKVDWALWIDADEVLEDLRVNKKNNTEFYDRISKGDYAPIKAIHKENTFYRTNFFKIKNSVEWVGKAHEYIHVEGKEVYLDDIFKISVYSEGSSWSNPEKKFMNYADLILEQIEEEPEEPRWVYFLAECYRHIRKPEYDIMAIEQYKKRMAMSGNEEEKYVSAMMYCSMIKKQRGLSVEELSILENSCYPERIENYLILAIHYYERANYNVSYAYCKQIEPYWNKVPRAALYVDTRTYCFIAPFLMACNAYVLKKDDEAKNAISICRKSGMATPMEKGTLSMIEKAVK